MRRPLFSRSVIRSASLASALSADDGFCDMSVFSVSVDAALFALRLQMILLRLRPDVRRVRRAEARAAFLRGQFASR